MTWINTLNVTDIVNGDKPYGDYWVEIPERPSPLHTWDGKDWVKTLSPVITLSIEERFQKIEQDVIVLKNK